jgi:hypothetical protein
MTLEVECKPKGDSQLVVSDFVQSASYSLDCSVLLSACPGPFHQQSIATFTFLQVETVAGEHKKQGDTMQSCLLKSTAAPVLGTPVCQHQR